MTALQTLSNQLPQLNSWSNHTKNEIEVLSDQYEARRVEIDLFFDDLKNRLELRRGELQSELLQVFEKEKENLRNKENELEKMKTTCQMLLSQYKLDLQSKMNLNSDLSSPLDEYSNFQSNLAASSYSGSPHLSG